MNAGAYLRVSRVGSRRDRESYGSPDDQAKAVEALAAQLGYRILRTVRDEDVSGGRAPRDRGLEELVLACEVGELQAILVYSFDRFTREHPYDAPVTLARLRDCGAKIVSAIEGFDSSTPMGIQMAGILAAQAYGYRERVKSTWDANVARAVARGAKVGKTPFGFSRGPDSVLVPNPHKAALLVKIFEKRADGESWASIARWLGKQGHQMSRSGLKHLIQNEVYLGVSATGGYRNETAHAPLVSRELFDRANAVRGRAPLRNGALASVAMLRSLVVCSGCGHVMTVGWTRGKKIKETCERERLPAYRCRGDSAAGRCQHRSYIRADALDEFLEKYVLAAFEGHGPLVEVLASGDRLETAAQELREAEHALAQFRANVRLAAALDPDEHAEMAENLKAAEVEARRGFNDARLDNDRNGGFEADMLAAWPLMTGEAKGRLLQGFVDRVVVTPAHRRRGIPVHTRVQVVFKGNLVLEPDDHTRILAATLS